LGARLTGFFLVVAMGLGASPAASRILRCMPIVVGIAVAGALGAVARYGLDELIGRRTGAFPWGIFVVNITGAFLIGLMVEALEPRFEGSWVRAAVVTGFLGAYTTFSTFSLDTYRLLDAGHTGQAAANAFGTLAAGLVAVWLGLKVGRTL
jgi:CrcB protein